jgi:hypothetical protein
MYNSGLVVVVKSNGKILREDKDLVFLPFNSEYSILLKNLDSRKALVNVSIDGQDVLDNKSLILDPNSKREIKGFLNGMSAKNRFKFIKKTEEISEYRGDRIDDGIIRVEYWFEKVIEKKQIITEYITSYPYPSFPPVFYNSSGIYGSSEGNNLRSSTRSINVNSTITKSLSNSEINSSLSTNFQPQEEGITVKGSEVFQQFSYGTIGSLEDNSKVIILKLIGTKQSGKIVQEPITIQTKKICPTCGRRSKSYAKHCSNCGTFLD